MRARYNLGIGCMNLGAYKEAVEHFLSALMQQSEGVAGVVGKEKQMSETIWGTLRLALSFLNRSDLYGACLSKDLDKLREEFKV